MSPIQEDALGLVLIACSIGVLVCRAEAASKRQAGAYRMSVDLETNIRFWTTLAWIFGVGALLVASWWMLFRLARL